MTTLIVVASNKPHRISNQAIHLLKAHGNDIVLVHPVLKEIEGLAVLPSVKDVKQKIDTVTMYVNAARSSEMLDDLLNLKPQQIIFNPGSDWRPFINCG